MKKKKKSSSRKASSQYEVTQIAIFIPILLLIIGGTFVFKAASKTHVLGTSTGPVLLAQGGDDSGSGGGGDSSSGSQGPSGSNGGSISSGSSGSGSSGGPSSSGDGSGPSGSLGDNRGTPLTVSGNISGSTAVDCVGPDGKHFTTEFHDCQELNQKWGNSNFHFTTLGLPTQKIETEQQASDVKPSETPQQEIHTKTEQLEVQKEGSKTELNLQSGNLHIEFKTEDNGTVKVVAQKEDGSEVELKSQDALDKMNEILSDKDIEIGSTSAHTLAVKSGNVEASTHFPLSVDPTTGELTVTTPAGSKTVTVLPDQAVQNLLSHHVMTDIQSQVASSEAAGIITTQQANLTVLGNEPVFEVNGISKKNFLGIFPIGFSKTAFVSAETGNVLKTDESAINKLLETLSF